MGKILFAGATGFLGSYLLPHILELGEVTIITRSKEKALKKVKDLPVKIIEGDLTNEDYWMEGIKQENWDIVINLVGENLFGRWTASKRKKIYESRVKGTENLIKALPDLTPLLINASAMGIYGHGEERLLSEESLPAEDDLALIVEEWERVAEDGRRKINRVVELRTGIVIAKDAIMIKNLSRALKFFVGGYPGKGKNFISWIHIQDYIRSILFIIKKIEIGGPVNLTAPEPVPFKKFCKEMGRILHRPCWLPIPVPLIRVALGDLAIFLTFSQRAIPAKLIEQDFEFKFPNLTEALKEILQGGR